MEALTQELKGLSNAAESSLTGEHLAGTAHFPAGRSVDYRIRATTGAYAIALRLSEAAPVAPQDKKPSGLRRVSDLRNDSIAHLLEDAVRLRASDLIITSEGLSSVRHGSQLLEVPGALFTPEQILESLGDLLTEERQALLEEEGSIDLAYELPRQGDKKPQRFRVNVFHHIHGLAAAFRPIWDTIPTFEDLNLPESLKDLADFPYGLVLLTGPTGAGKSTTLCSALELVNERRHCHIITLEDPIEFVFSRKKAVIHQREIGVHVSTFSQGLRAALRENPDIILVGEMRDRETVAAAITAAETGHLVLSTLHCGNAAQAIDRIIDIFPEHQQSQIRVQLGDCLKAIVTQRLLPVMGSSERVPAVEILRVNTAVSNMIRERKTHLLASQMQTSREEGMLPFDESIISLYRAKIISADTAIRAASEPKTIRSKLGIEE